MPSNQVRPRPEFYEIFASEEIEEIIYSLEAKKEIPYKFCFKDQGAITWDKSYLDQTKNENLPIQEVVDLLRLNFEYIHELIRAKKTINIIDIGQGNSYSVQHFITQLSKVANIKSYTAVDISRDMIYISERNIREWFPLIQFQGYNCDIESSEFINVLEPAIENNEQSVNLFLYLGAMISINENRSKILGNFKKIMNLGDLLILSNFLEFSDNFTHILSSAKFKRYSWIAELIGIGASNCKINAGLTDDRNIKFSKIEMNRDYIIEFNFDGETRIVKLSQGEEVTLWKCIRTTIPQLLKDIDVSKLKLRQLSTDKIKPHVLVICESLPN